MTSHVLLGRNACMASSFSVAPLLEFLHHPITFRLPVWHPFFQQGCICSVSLLTWAFLRHHPTTLRLPGPLPLLPNRQGLHLCSGTPSRGRTHGQGPGECMVTGKVYIIHETLGGRGG